MTKRILNWDGCTNARDLGGLHTLDGRQTRWQAVVRSDTPSRLTAAGWSALYAYGIRTIITLRTHGQTEPELNFSPPQPALPSCRSKLKILPIKRFCSSGRSQNSGLPRSITKTHCSAGLIGMQPPFRPLRRRSRGACFSIVPVGMTVQASLPCCC